VSVKLDCLKLLRSVTFILRHRS